MCGFCLSRRGLFRAALVGGAAAALAGASLAQAAPYRVDVHYHHVAPGWLADEDVAKGLPGLVVKTAREWSPARAVEEMDRFEIATTICSVPNPGVWLGNVAQARRLSRVCNDYAAQMERDHRGRFGQFAAIPLPDVEGSLAEIEYALDTLRADGIGLFTSYGDKWLADPAFAPVFRELNRRKAVVFVHPIAPSCCRSLLPGISAAVLEYPVDTTRTMLQWIMAKATTTYPDLKLIFSHAGGVMTAAAGRLGILFATQPGLRDQAPADLRAELGKFYYEISSSADAVTLGALRATAPTSHILLGTDSPFGPTAPTIDRLKEFDLPAAERRAIERDNALALLGRPR